MQESHPANYRNSPWTHDQSITVESGPIRVPRSAKCSCFWQYCKRCLSPSVNLPPQFSLTRAQDPEIPDSSTWGSNSSPNQSGQSFLEDQRNLCWRAISRNMYRPNSGPCCRVGTKIGPGKPLGGAWSFSLADSATPLVRRTYHHQPPQLFPCLPPSSLLFSS